MASFIQVPRDLSKVKTKVFLGLTKRQLICFGLAAILGLPSYFALRAFAGKNAAMFGMILVMAPCFLFAMYEKDGQPMEKVMANFIRSRFTRPKKRPYKTENYYEALERQAQVNEEVKRIVKGNKQAHGQG
ncbi:MAG: PrgI family protein [Eubacteriales bacterium]|nr:PrgI family protein [Eubacteriales bacterium]